MSNTYPQPTKAIFMSNHPCRWCHPRWFRTSVLCRIAACRWLISNRGANHIRGGGDGNAVAERHDRAFVRAALDAGAHLIGFVVIPITGVAMIDSTAATATRSTHALREVV